MRKRNSPTGRAGWFLKLVSHRLLRWKYHICLDCGQYLNDLFLNTVYKSDSVVRLRAVGHSRGRCRPAGCWWVWVYQRRRSASSTGRLWPESPGDSGPCPAWQGQLYRQPATRSCGRRTWKRNNILTLDLNGLVRGSTYLFMRLWKFYDKDRLMEESAHSFFFSPVAIKICVQVS